MTELFIIGIIVYLIAQSGKGAQAGGANGSAGSGCCAPCAGAASPAPAAAVNASAAVIAGGVYDPLQPSSESVLSTVPNDSIFGNQSAAGTLSGTTSAASYGGA